MYDQEYIIMEEIVEHVYGTGINLSESNVTYA